MVWIEGTAVTDPVDASFVADSPYSLEPEDVGFGIYADGIRVAGAAPADRPRFYGLTTDDGERLIGRVLEPEEALRLRRQADNSVAFDLSAEDIVRAVVERRAQFALANGWELVRRLVLGRGRLEIRGPGPRDLDNLKRKIDAGGDFIVTQLFFRNDAFFDFVERVRAAPGSSIARCLRTVSDYGLQKRSGR